MLFYSKRDLLLSEDDKRKKTASIKFKKAIEFDSNKEYDIFLSHSYKDKVLIVKLNEELINFGYSVYIDWKEDPHLPRNYVTKRNADRIRYRMQHCKSLIYATSQNAISSKWTPWELGFMDGFTGRTCVLPITENSDYKGVEYLSLYPIAGKGYNDLSILNEFGLQPYREWLQKRTIRWMRK